MIFRKKRKHLFLLFAVFLCSCSSNFSNAVRDDVSTLQVSGELTHTQYWDKNDEWDLNGLFVIAVFSDGQSNSFSFESNCILYRCSPEKPELGVSQLSIIDVFYLDSSNVKHLVTDELRYDVTVVNYPYDYAKFNYSDLIVPVALVATVFIGFAFFIVVYKSKKRKG